MPTLKGCEYKQFFGLKPSLSKLHATSGEPLQDEGKHHHLASKSERCTREPGTGQETMSLSKPGHHNLL